MIYSCMGYEVRLLPPAAEFLEGLPDRLRAKAARAIALLREFGPYPPGAPLQEGVGLAWLV